MVIQKSEEVKFMELASIAANLMTINMNQGLKLFKGVKEELEKINNKEFDGTIDVKACFDFCKYTFLHDHTEGVNMLMMKQAKYKKPYYIPTRLVSVLVPGNWGILVFRGQGKIPTRFKLISSWYSVDKCEISDGIIDLNAIEELDDHYLWTERSGKSYHLLKKPEEEFSPLVEFALGEENYSVMYMADSMDSFFSNEESY